MYTKRNFSLGSGSNSDLLFNINNNSQLLHFNIRMGCTLKRNVCLNLKIGCQA